jgi:hypothetical protein
MGNLVYSLNKKLSAKVSPQPITRLILKIKDK